MPHIPDSAHPTHDLELIAAFAADDLESRELERARAIVASCADCARLADDLRAIAAAIAVIPAPAWSRDFRLSRDDAARLRPSGPRGFLAGLSGPRFAFATPLGTAFAAIGIVGVVAASGGLPAGGGATGAAPEALTIEEASAPVEEAPYQLPVEADPTLPLRADDANPLLLGSPVPGATGGDPEIAGDPQGTVGPDAAEGSGVDTAAAPKGAAPDPLLVPAAGLVVLGSGLVLLRAGARRLA